MPLKDPEAQKAYWRKWYASNKLAREKQRRKVKERKKEIKEWFKNLKRAYACGKCGRKGIACLDFHHRNRNEKLHGVNDLARKGYSKDAILKEIAKCDVLCANCHIAHHNRSRSEAKVSPQYRMCKERKMRKYAIVDEYKKSQGCSICRIKNPSCLEFHHKNPANKKERVSQLIQDSASMKKIWAEIAKCDVLCRNCHRELHASESGATRI